MTSTKIKKALAIIGSMFSTATFACAYEPYIGSVCVMATNYCPEGYVMANGQSLSVQNNQALYSLIGITYGGTPSQTFNVPDLRGRSVVGYGQGSALSPLAYGAKRGQEQINLTINQLPQHNHTATFQGTMNGTVAGTFKVSNSNGTSNSPTNNAYIGRPAQAAGAREPANYLYTTDTSNLTDIQGLNVSSTVNIGSGSITVGMTGSNAPVPTIPPQLAMTYCIATTGIYPVRP